MAFVNKIIFPTTKKKRKGEERKQWNQHKQRRGGIYHVINLCVQPGVMFRVHISKARL